MLSPFDDAVVLVSVVDIFAVVDADLECIQLASWPLVVEVFIPRRLAGRRSTKATTRQTGYEYHGTNKFSPKSCAPLAPSPNSFSLNSELYGRLKKRGQRFSSVALPERVFGVFEEGGSRWKGGTLGKE